MLTPQGPTVWGRRAQVRVVLYLYGGDCGGTLQSSHSRVLSARVWTGKSQEGGARRLYAETADHAHRDAQASDVLADDTAATGLTVKTVADPNYLTFEEFWRTGKCGHEWRVSSACANVSRVHSLCSRQVYRCFIASII